MEDKNAWMEKFMGWLHEQEKSFSDAADRFTATKQADAAWGMRGRALSYRECIDEFARITEERVFN